MLSNLSIFHFKDLTQQLKLKLKLPATRCGESPTVKENVFFIRSPTPPQAAGNALAVQFKDMKGTTVSLATRGPKPPIVHKIPDQSL